MRFLLSHVSIDRKFTFRDLFFGLIGIAWIFSFWLQQRVLTVKIIDLGGFQWLSKVCTASEVTLYSEVSGFLGHYWGASRNTGSTFTTPALCSGAWKFWISSNSEVARIWISSLWITFQLLDRKKSSTLNVLIIKWTSDSKYDWFLYCYWAIPILLSVLNRVISRKQLFNLWYELFTINRSHSSWNLIN